MQNTNKIIQKNLTKIKKKQTKYQVNLLSNQKKYIKYSQERESSTQRFLQNKQIFNKNTGEFTPIGGFTLQKKYSKDYNYVSSVTNHINYLAVLQNLVPVFLTITLPSKYHPTATITNKKRIPNKKFDVELGKDYVKKGYQTLQNSFRKLLRILTKHNTKNNIKTPYFRIIEYHKDFTPHLHCVIYFNKNFVDKKINDIHRVIGNMIALEELGEQYKLEVLKDPQKGAGYLLKYFKKTIKPKNKNNLYLLDGWKKLNNIRLFTHSQTSLNKMDFIRIIRDFTINIEPLIKKTDDYLNRYTYIAKNTEYLIFRNKDINDDEVNIKTNEIQKTLKKDNEYIYLVVESREKKEVISNITKNFMQGLQKKLQELSDYITLNEDKLEDKIIKTKECLFKIKHNFCLLEQELNQENIIKRLGVRRVQNALEGFKKEINKNEIVLKDLLDVEYRITKQKFKKYDNYDFDFRTKKGNEDFNEYMTLKNKIKMLNKKIDIKMLEVLDDMEALLVEIMETKYRTLDKRIYRIMQNEIIKLYDKKDVEMVEFAEGFE